MAKEALLWSVKNGDLDALKNIVDKPGFDVNAEVLNGRNPLHYAADYGQKDVLEYLCGKGANIDLPDKHGISALLAAIYEDHVDCVKLLISKGAKKDGKGPDGKSYLESASPEAQEALK